MFPDELTSERLSLRQPGDGDLAALFAIHSDPATHRYYADVSDHNLPESRARLADWQAHWQAQGYGYWAVGLRGDAAVIGFGGLRRRDEDGSGALNLYYRFRSAAWGRGYATEMARFAVELAFAWLGAHSVTALVNPENAPSVRVLGRIGMRPVEDVRYGPQRLPRRLYVAGPDCACRRQAAGGVPKARLKARLKAASDS